jgi:hypothetical protein
MVKTVTLDTNVFQHIMRPHLFPNDRDPKSLQIVHDALKANLLKGFVADPIAHIEQIPKTKRSAYFAGVRTLIQGSEELLPGGILKLSYKVSPDPTAHPGLPGVLVDCLKESLAMGVAILRCPRIAVPLAPEVDPTWYAADTDIASRQMRFEDALKAIEDRGVGIAVLKAVGREFLKRDGKSGEWHEGLALSRDGHDEGKIKRGWAEWADGDSMAAHIAYQNDYFCSRDEAVSAGLSIFNENNQAWLKKTYNVSIVSPTTFAKLGSQ